MNVLLMKGRGFVSSGIRWVTNGEVSHAAILTPDNTIIEAWQGAGVRERPMLTDLTDVEFYDVLGMDQKKWSRVYEYGRSQIGKGYNYKGVAAFVIPFLNGKSEGNAFCSELLSNCFVYADNPLLKRIKSSEISPQAIRTSPLLVGPIIY